MNALTKKEAIKAGLRPLTSAYTEAETWMLENADLRRGGRAFALVAERAGISIWQK